MNTLGLEHRPGRCDAGFDIKTQHPAFCKCSAGVPVAPHELIDSVDAAYPVFKAAVRKVVRADGTVHAADLRPLTRGRIAPKTLATCYRMARAEHLLNEVGHERSDDEAGKNAGRMEPYYELGVAA